MTTEFVDAYAHCGLSKYRPLPQLEEAMHIASVDRAVLVQHFGEFDNSYLQQILETNPSKFAGVFLIDPASPQALEHLEQWSETEAFRGVRFVTDSLISHGALWHRAAELGLNLVIYAPNDVTRYMTELTGFLNEHSSTTIVLSHFGLGREREEQTFFRQRSAFQLAEHENVYFQVSGMHMFCDYPFEPMQFLVNDAMLTFGPDRMLWGGNYPVMGSDQDYAREAEFIRSGGFDVQPEDVDKITCRTAMRVWFSQEEL